MREIQTQLNWIELYIKYVAIYACRSTLVNIDMKLMGFFKYFFSNFMSKKLISLNKKNLCCLWMSSYWELFCFKLDRWPQTDDDAIVENLQA